MSYAELGASIGRMVDEKQLQYGKSFDHSSAILAQLYPQGVKVKDFPHLLAIVRILDKFFRIANNITAGGESPWLDIAGYALLMNGSAYKK